jgi:AraC family transcriptional regulator, L-rhamnose operon regulatory protein RhaS
VITEDVEPHDHEYHEICLVLSGSAVHQTDDGKRDLGPGSLFIIPPGDVHAITGVTELDLINTYYLSEWLSLDLPALWAEPGAVTLFLNVSDVRFSRRHACQIDLDDFADLCADFAALEREWDRETPSALILRALFLKIAAGVARQWCQHDSNVLAMEFHPEVWAEIRRIEIAVTSGHGLELGRTPGRGLSKNYLSNLFRRQIGMSRSDYFQHRRVQKACELLLLPDRTITEVAADLGYSDAPHFCRLFKRHRGMSPRGYRARYLAS